MYYKAPNNSLHVIEPEFAHLLPSGCVPITEEEAEAMRPVSSPPTPQQQLAILDAQYPLTQRNLRDFIMLTAEALKSGTPIDVTGAPAVQVVYAVEAQAAVLRAQLSNEALIKDV